MENDWMNLLMQCASVVLNAVLAVALPYLLIEVIKWVRAKKSEAFARVSNEQRQMIEQAVRTAVLAAEQLGLAGKVEDKFRYAWHVADGWLMDRGLNIDADMLESAIEAAVFSEFNWGKKPALPEPEPPAGE
jgi:hypothetical protein